MNALLKMLCVLAFVYVFAAFATEGDSGAAKAGEQIVTAICTRCHSTARICTNLGGDAAFWQATAAKMQKNGAPLDEADVPVLVEYLSGLTAGSKPVCK